MDDRAKALDLLRKLQLRTEERGATAAEATQAALLAKRIRQRYGIDNAEVGSAEVTRELPSKRWPDWATVLGMAIEDAFPVRVFFYRAIGLRSRVKIVGPEGDVQIAAWLWNAVETDLLRACAAELTRTRLRGVQIQMFRTRFLAHAAWQVYYQLVPRKKLAELVPVDDDCGGRARNRKVKPISVLELSAYMTGSEAGRKIKVDTNVLPGATRALEYAGV